MLYVVPHGDEAVEVSCGPWPDTGIGCVPGLGATAAVNVLSCGGSGSGCHVTPTTDDGGALNFEIDQRKAKATFQCIKCHINEGKKPVPESHSKAIIDIKKQ